MLKVNNIIPLWRVVIPNRCWRLSRIPIDVFSRLLGHSLEASVLEAGGQIHHL